MPNKMPEQRPQLAFKEYGASMTDQAEASSLLRAVDIVKLYEQQAIGIDDFEDAELISIEEEPPPLAGGIPRTVGSWFSRFVTEFQQGAATMARAQGVAQPDPQSAIRQVFTTVPSDTNWLKDPHNRPPGWSTLQRDAKTLIKGFVDGYCEEPAADTCQRLLTTYYSRAVDIDAFWRNVQFRLGNLRSVIRTLPPHLATLARDWIETVEILGAPLALCVAYFGAEETIACTLEISKHGEDFRSVEVAAHDHKRLQIWGEHTQLVTTVQETRELIMATRTYGAEAYQLFRAFGTYKDWAADLIGDALEPGGRQAGQSLLKAITGIRRGAGTVAAATRPAPPSPPAAPPAAGAPPPPAAPVATAPSPPAAPPAAAGEKVEQREGYQKSTVYSGEVKQPPPPAPETNEAQQKGDGEKAAQPARQVKEAVSGLLREVQRYEEGTSRSAQWHASEEGKGVLAAVQREVQKLGQAVEEQGEQQSSTAQGPQPGVATKRGPVKPESSPQQGG